MASRIELASNCFSNVSNMLVAPASWYGRCVVALFKDALPADHPYVEVVVRIITFAILAILSLSLLVFGPLALIGLAIRNTSQPVKPPPVSPSSAPAAASSPYASPASVAASSPPVQPAPSVELPPASSSSAPASSPYASPASIAASSPPVQPAPSVEPPPASSSSVLVAASSPYASPASAAASPPSVQPPPASSSSVSAAASSSDVVHVSEDQPSIQEQMAKHVERLRRLYEDLRDLTQQGQLQQLSQELEEFEKQYGSYRKKPDAWTPEDKNFISYDEIVSNLKGIKTALAYMDIGNWRASSDVTVEADADGVIAQLKDGNCWLHSTLCGLSVLNHDRAQEFTYQTLRPVVIQWLEDNQQDQTVHQLLQTAIDDHKQAASHSLNEQRDSLAAALAGDAISQGEYTQAMQPIEAENKNLEAFGLPAYFALMRQQGSHGSRAELYAISQIFRVSIRILRDFPAHNGHPRRITANWDLPINHPEAVGTINVVLNQQGNHFNYQIPQS